MRWLAVAGFEPVGWGQGGGVFGQRAGQAGEYVGEIFLGIDAKAAAVFDDGVRNGAFLTRFLVADEQPVLGSELGEADGITDGFAEFALGQDGTPKCEFVDGLPDSLVNHAAFGGADGLAQGGAGLGFAQALFNVIEVGELTQEPTDEPRELFGGFEKFPSNIRHPDPAPPDQDV